MRPDEISRLRASLHHADFILASGPLSDTDLHDLEVDLRLIFSAIVAARRKSADEIAKLQRPLSAPELFDAIKSSRPS